MRALPGEKTPIPLETIRRELAGESINVMVTDHQFSRIVGDRYWVVKIDLNLSGGRKVKTTFTATDVGVDPFIRRRARANADGHFESTIHFDDKGYPVLARQSGTLPEDTLRAIHESLGDT